MSPVLCHDCMVAGSAALLAAQGDSGASTEPGRPVVIGLVRHAALLAEIAEERILGRGRQAVLARLRHAVVWATLSQVEAGGFVMSLPQIGRALGGRDHSTIINSRERAEALVARDPEFAWLCERLWAAAECEPWGPAKGYLPPDLKEAAAALASPLAEEDDDEEDDANDEARADCAMRQVSEALFDALRREHPDKVRPLPPTRPRAEAARAGYVRVAA